MTYSPAPPLPPTGSSNSQVMRQGVVVVGLIAIAALVVGIVALARSGSSAEAGPSGETAPTYNEAEVSQATKGVCAAWSMADEATWRALNDPPADQDLATQRVNARAALANAAGLLDIAITRAPEAKPEVVAAALGLAEAYRKRIAVGIIGSDDARLPSVVSDAEAAQTRMGEVCGGG